MKNARRKLLKLACGALAGAGLGLHRAAARAQKPVFRDADRTRDKIVALVRALPGDNPRAMRHIQKIEPITDISIAGVTVPPEQLPPSSPQGMVVQVPAQNGVPPSHFTPHAPQFSGSFAVLTQVPLQHSRPVPHAGDHGSHATAPDWLWKVPDVQVKQAVRLVASE